MSTKRRNRSRWDSSRSPATSPSAPPSAAPPSATAPAPAAAAAAAAMAAASPTPAAQTRSPNVSLPPPVSNFSLDYRYELSLPAQMLMSRLERQPWLDPVSDYSNTYSSRDPAGYGSHGRHYGSFPGDAPSQLEDYPSVLQSSEVLQHYPGALRNEKSQLSGQFGSGMASEAPPYLDPMRERWHAAGLGGQNSSLYGLPSGHGDVGYALQLARTSEFSSERGLGGRRIDATIIDGQAGSASLTAGRDDVLKDIKGQDSLEKLPIGLQDPKLYCRTCDRAFPTAHQREAHFHAHVKCNEEHCLFEATARVMKEHMLVVHKKQFQNALRASGGSQNEAEEVQPNETQKSNAESSDGKQVSEMLEPLERQKGGLSTPSGRHPQDVELLARKSRENKNYRFPGRYTPY